MASKPPFLLFRAICPFCSQISQRAPTVERKTRVTSFLFASQTRLQPQFKCFTSSSCFLKSAKKKAELKGVADADPFDFSELEGGIEKAHSKLKDDLSKLKPGGRFNPENVENLRVQVIKNSKATERLGTLAQVIPRGRTLNLIVGEKDFVKPITSAIQASKLNLIPQSDPHNSLQLNINLPPPTTDSRIAVLEEAKKIAGAANVAIKNAQQVQHKKFRLMELSRSVRGDELKRARVRMEKLVQDGAAEAKRVADSARKALENG